MPHCKARVCRARDCKLLVPALHKAAKLAEAVVEAQAVEYANPGRVIGVPAYIDGYFLVPTRLQRDWVDWIDVSAKLKLSDCDCFCLLVFQEQVKLSVRPDMLAGYSNRPKPAPINFR
jgi:hypothetical protein